MLVVKRRNDAPPNKYQFFSMFLVIIFELFDVWEGTMMILSLVHLPENIMHMTIQANGFVLTTALKVYTEKRLLTALGWAGRHLGELHVSLSDINGPRGGIDKRCRILVQISGGKGVVIEDTAADLYHAIDRAAERVDRAVVRRIEQMRGFSHVRVFGASADATVIADGDPR